MSLEAAAGKNPVTHVGKLYNALAGMIAEALCAQLDRVAAAQCMLVSRIGQPIAEPALVEVRIETADGAPVDALRARVDEIAAATIPRVAELAEDFLEGRRAVA
jgi:S-adenosylmethionine synthetase